MEIENINIEEAKGNLEKFLIDMNKWEVNFHRDRIELLNNDQNTSARVKSAYDELNSIFNKYCIPEKCDRRRLDSLDTGIPTTYDIERDLLQLHKTTKDSITFLYKQYDGWDIYFVLKKHGGDWMLHKAQYFDTDKQKLAVFIL